MSGSIFPLDPGKIAWSSKIKPKWETTKYVSAGQGRKTLTHQEYPTWQFDVSFPALTEQEMNALLAFHMTCKGAWNPFYYKDFERHDANVTLKDGETYYYRANGLQLIIPIAVGDYVFGEPCYMADNVRVYRDGVEDTENFEVVADETGALIVYLTDVETDEGVLQNTVITATYEYYYKVAFADSITINQKFKNLYSVSLTLETVKQAITNTGDNDKWHGTDLYNISIVQGSHQTITVKKYVNGSLTGTYTGDFQVLGECILEITVTPDDGYVAGDLYINNRRYTSGVRLTLTEDLLIYAYNAELGSFAFINGDLERFTSSVDYYFIFYANEECTTRTDSKNNLQGKLVVKDVREYAGTYAGGLLGSNNSFNQICTNITQADVSDIKVDNSLTFQFTFASCSSLLKIIGLKTWNPINATSFTYMFSGDGNLADIGDISGWKTPNLTTISNMFYRSGVTCVDFHDWYTPNLANVSECFDSALLLRVVDISGIDTTNVMSATRFFNSNTSLKYVIMDSDDVKFSGSISCPDGNSNVKYLVRSSKLEAYRTHTNWSARASRILDIADFDIVRENGQITVTERTT